MLSAQTGGWLRRLRVFRGIAGDADFLIRSAYPPFTSPGGGFDSLYSSSPGLMLRSSSLRFAGVMTRSESIAMEWTLSEDLAALSAAVGVASGLLGIEPSLVLGLTDKLCSRSF